MTEKVRHGANGEFLAATWLLEELGRAAGPYDIQMVAQVIAYAARDSKTDAEAASRALLASAQAAIEAGENVNVFWFKDRKFAQVSGRERLRSSQGLCNESYVPRTQEEQEADERKRQDEEEAAYQMYKSMSAAFRKANPHRSWDARLSAVEKGQRDGTTT